MRGVSHDNGTVAKVWVNGQVAQIIHQQAGVADWSIRMDAASDGRYIAHAIDRAGNVERTPHQLQFDPA